MEDIVCIIPNTISTDTVDSIADEIDIEDGELSSDSGSRVEDTSVSLQGKALKNLHVELELPEKQSTTNVTECKDPEQTSDIADNNEDVGIKDLKVHNLETLDVDDDREVNVYLGEGLTVSNRVYENKNATFVTGIDVASEEARVKRLDRAKRFGITAVKEDSYEENMRRLYESLDMCTDDGVADIYRLDTIHLRGTDEMSTDDIFWYYRDFPPDKLEWIDDSSCNVVWSDAVSAYRAIAALSSPIVLRDGKKGEEEKGGDIIMEDQQEGMESTASPEGHDLGLEHDTESILTSTTDNLQEDNPTKTNETNTELSNLPEGKWRIGVAHPKSNLLVMRYATTSDCKKFAAEKYSKYYVKYGNPNYGGVPGIITESKRKRMRISKLKQDLDKIAQQQTKAPKRSTFTESSVVMPKRPRINSPTAFPYSEICSVASEDEAQEDIVDNENVPEENSDSDDEKPKWKGLVKGMRADDEERKQRKREFAQRVRVPIWKRISFDREPSYSLESGIDARQILNARRRNWRPPGNVSISVPSGNEYEDANIEEDLYARYHFSNRDSDDDDARSSRAEKDSGSEVEDGELKDSPRHQAVGKLAHMWENVLREQKLQDAANTYENEFEDIPPAGRELVSYGDMVDLGSLDSEPESIEPIVNCGIVRLTTRQKSVDSASSSGSSCHSESGKSSNVNTSKHRSWRRLRSPTPLPDDETDLRHKLFSKQKRKK